MNNALGNVFLVSAFTFKLLHKRTFRLFILCMCLGFLLIPCSHCLTYCNSNSPTSTSPKLNQISLIFTDYWIFLEVDEDENIFVTERITLKNELDISISDLTLYYNQTISIINIRNDQQSVDNFTLNSSNVLLIEFNNALQPNETKEIEINYSLENLIQRWQGNYLRLYFEYYKYLVLKETFIVRLPKHSEIYDGPGEILPLPDEFWNEHGYIEIFWYDSVQNYIQVIFKIQSNPIWFYIIGPIVGLAVGVGGTLWFVRKKEEKTMKDIGKIFLSETEKMILKLISENGGKVTQAELSTITGFTKTKISRNLISLENQELIVREKWGKNYRVYISEMGQKVVEFGYQNHIKKTQ